jgi:hypothetical protein
MRQRARSTRLHFLAVPVISVGLFLHYPPGPSIGSSGCRNVQLSTPQFVSPEVGWARGTCGAHAGILRTKNGGRTWADVTPRTMRPLLDEALGTDFLDGTHAWIAGRATHLEDVVFRTSDGGHSWHSALVRVADANTYAPYFAAVSRLNQRRGWLYTIDAGMLEFIQSLYETEDGGAHWKLVVPLRGTRPISGILRFQTSTLGYGAVLRGGGGPNVVYRSEDGGRYWKAFTLPLPSMYRRVHVAVLFYSVQTTGNQRVTLPAVVAPLDVGSHSSLIVYRSDHAGRDWVRGAALNLYSSDGDARVAFANVRDGWVITRRGLYRTVDAGETWAKLETNINLRRSFDLDFVSARVGFVLVWNKNSQSLMRTDNGGKTWTTEEQMPG